MKVSCLIIIFFAMILCQTAAAVEQFDLLPCIEGDSGGMLYCIEYDSTGDISYLHDNITRRITIKLPIQVLTHLWLNQGEIVIVTPSGEVINNGQELTRSQDRDRWTITFTFQHVNSDFGKLNIDFHIKDVTYIDEQILHVKIRTEDNVFVTREKIWIPVDVNSNNEDHDHEGEVITTDHPASDDPSAILLASIKTLQNEKEALQKEKMSAENALIHYQNASIHYKNKYYRCLEAKDDLEISTKPGIHWKGQNKLDITTLGIFIPVGIAVMAIMAYIASMVKGSKLVSTGTSVLTLANTAKTTLHILKPKLKDKQAATAATTATSSLVGSAHATDELIVISNGNRNIEHMT